MDGEEVKPVLLVFFGAEHGYLIVDKHPVQALIWNRTCTRTTFVGFQSTLLIKPTYTDKNYTNHILTKTIQGQLGVAFLHEDGTNLYPLH